MPALPPNATLQDDSDIQVLVTGFGAFKNFLNNPSWLAVKPLHDLYLPVDTSHPPDTQSFLSNSDASPQAPSSSSSPRRIHIQTLQLAVAYQPLLDTIPRLHSSFPTSPHAKPWLDPNNDQDGSSGNGRSYPQGYSRISHPSRGYDVILNVGVGLKGDLAIETRGHKKGYRLKDSMGLKAPPFRDQNQDHGFNRSKETEAEKAERLRMEVEKDIDGVLRGFDEGYQEFQDEEVTHIEADKLLEFLKSRNVPTRKSEDAGRFLCDFLCYSSMCESRRSDPAKIKSKRAKTLFIHIPPPGEVLTTEEASEAIKAIVWFMVCVDKGGIL